MAKKNATRTIPTTGPNAAKIVPVNSIGTAILGCKPVAKTVRVVKKGRTTAKTKKDE